MGGEGGARREISGPGNVRDSYHMPDKWKLCFAALPCCFGQSGNWHLSDVRSVSSFPFLRGYPTRQMWKKNFEEGFPGI